MPALPSEGTGSASFGPKSDIDVLVSFDPEAPIGFVALSELQRGLTRAFGRKVDLVPKDGLKPAIREQILAQAEVIYAA